MKYGTHERMKTCKKVEENKALVSEKTNWMSTKEKKFARGDKLVADATKSNKIRQRKENGAVQRKTERQPTSNCDGFVRDAAKTFGQCDETILKELSRKHEEREKI